MVYGGYQKCKPHFLLELSEFLWYIYKEINIGFIIHIYYCLSILMLLIICSFLTFVVVWSILVMNSMFYLVYEHWVCPLPEEHGPS